MLRSGNHPDMTTAGMMARWTTLLAAVVMPLAAAPVDILTANYNNARTNANLNETGLSTANVNRTKFGKIFSLPVNGFISAQPLYVHGLGIPGKGTHNVIYVATQHNDVYAFDADKAGASLWHVNLGPAVPASDYNMNDLQTVGILGTPVIDRVTSTIYAVADTKEDGKYIYRLHALDLATGQETFGAPVEIQATVAGTSRFDSHAGQIQFNPVQHLQRPGLLLLNNVVYAAFGSHGDTGIWHGWLIGYNAKNVQEQTSATIMSPGGWGASIWQAGRAPAADEEGNIYASTGNGSFDGKANWGESFVKLDASSGTPTIADWFAPEDWSSLNDLDNDLGSCGPLLTSAGDLIGGGKEGIIYLINRAQMGHVQAGNSQIPQSFQAVGFGIFNLAFWDRAGNPILYTRADDDVLKSFSMRNGRFETKPLSQATVRAGLPLDGIAISANGSSDSSGIVWLASTANGRQNGAGTLHAYAALNLKQELWNSDSNSSRDSLGTLAKFATPTVANGKVYVATFSGRLMVYGILPQSSTPPITCRACALDVPR